MSGILMTQSYEAILVMGIKYYSTTWLESDILIFQEQLLVLRDLLLFVNLKGNVLMRIRIKWMKIISQFEQSIGITSKLN